MKQILLTTVLSLSFATATVAQEKLWTLDECMRYAVENSPSADYSGTLAIRTFVLTLGME